jgi:hypothetical protein
MFKNNGALCVALRSLLALLLLSGCRLGGRHAATIDLKQPGWTLKQGQAVWRTLGSASLLSPKAVSECVPSTTPAPELAGEVLLATRPGQAFVQFSKPPFTILNATVSPRHWQVHFSARNLTHAGPGNPPLRLLWLWLPTAMQGGVLPHSLNWVEAQQRWKLSNRTTGESIEGYFEQ